MPLYEFLCDDCGKKFEVLFRSTTERRKPACSHCRSGNVRKQFSTFAMSGKTPGKGGGGGGGGGGCASCHSGSCSTCRH